jgi:hypothetical protein
MAIAIKALRVEQLLAIKERAKTDEWAQFRTNRIADIRETLHDSMTPLESSLVAVALITCVEVELRQILRQFIDYRKECLANAGKFLGEAKLKIDHVEALHGQRLTPGDLIAYSISFSDLATIDNVFSSALGIDKFLNHLTETAYTNSDLEAVKLSDETRTVIGRLYDLRHKVVHEAIIEDLRNEMSSSIDHVEAFLKAFGAYRDDRLLHARLWTQAAMTEFADIDLLEVTRLKDATVSDLSGVFCKEDREELALIESKFDEAVDLYARFWARCFGGGGTIESQLFAVSKSSQLKVHVEDLQEQLKFLTMM